jgi:hypothetical protein
MVQLMPYRCTRTSVQVRGAIVIILYVSNLVQNGCQGIGAR